MEPKFAIEPHKKRRDSTFESSKFEKPLQIVERECVKIVWFGDPCEVAKKG